MPAHPPWLFMQLTLTCKKANFHTAMSSSTKPAIAAAAAAGSKRQRSDNERVDGRKSNSSAAPLTAEGEMPQKKFYRSRAHVNPLSHNNAYDYPVKPSLLDWTAEHYPNHPALLDSEKLDGAGAVAGDGCGDTQSADQNLGNGRECRTCSRKNIAPDVLDIGCGFGGLTIALSTLLPDSTILGLEIRDKVTEYVRLRIAALRKDHPGQYQNCSVLRSNTMKFMPNLFAKSSLEKVFFCFPDPHFKRKNHPRRIISERLLSEYAYFLKPTVGRLYCITDVEELHQWHLAKCRSHPLFRELGQEEMDADPCVAAMCVETEEGKKVERAGAAKYYVVYQRLADEDVLDSKGITAENFWTEGEFGVKRIEGESAE